MQPSERGNGCDAIDGERLGELLARARENDKEAIAILLQEFTPELFTVIRANMPQQIRNAYDSWDFFQNLAVALVKLDVYPAFASPKAFLAYVAKMAKHTVLMAARKQLGTKKRDARRQVSLHCVADEDEPKDKEVSALERIIKDEAWEVVLSNEPPINRFILRQRRAGYTQRQIAETLNLDERLVRSLLKGVIQRHGWREL